MTSSNDNYSTFGRTSKKNIPNGSNPTDIERCDSMNSIQGHHRQSIIPRDENFRPVDSNGTNGKTDNNTRYFFKLFFHPSYYLEEYSIFLQFAKN